MDHFSDAPKMELIVRGSTLGIVVSSTFLAHSQYKIAGLKAGAIKPGSTGPRIWTGLAMLGQVGGMWSFIGRLLRATGFTSRDG